MALTDKAFSKRQAYSYLEELQNEFVSQYGSKIDSQVRPYGFIEFGKILSTSAYPSQPQSCDSWSIGLKCF